METLQSLIQSYGYVAVFVGCFLEGETVLVLAGFAAHMGYLSLPAVIGTAAVAGFLGDQVLYWIGRRWGERIFASHPKLAALRPHAIEVVAKYGSWAAFGLRFMVGLRLVGAMSIGAANFPERRFLPVNALGAVVWAIAVGGAGYVFGQAFTIFLERARHLELAAFAVVGVLGVITVVVMRRRQARFAR